ncbi:hypothetical protein RRG08_056663 [Elysia crispata]|uniref:DIX domain-containing protein n=1 Tax=Elysia crispata TaxID=231223 RepID=A0AAE1CY04_9GAST|nr:hypothetical protein RRG08_056663 [Elysia crispata]
MCFIRSFFRLLRSDGYPHHLRKKHHRKAMMKSLAQQNREFRTGLHSQIIPRTEHAPKDRNVAETDPKRFAELLADKLTKVLEERESSAKVEQKLRSISEADKLEDPSEKLVASFSKPAINNSVSSSTAHNTSSSAAHNTSASFIPLMRPPEEETAESILDQHCMRIWASSHHTPSYSPPGGHHSPPPLPGKADARKKLMAAVAAANTSSTSSNSFTGGVIGQPLSFGSSPRSYHHKKRGASAGAAEFLAQSSSSSSSQPFDSGILEDRNLILLGTETHRHIHHHHHHHHSSGGGSSKKGSSALVEADTPSHSWRTSSSATEAQAQNLSSDFTLPEYAGRGRSSTRKSGVGGGSGGGISSSALRKSSDTSSNIDSGISVMFDKDSLRVPSNWSSNPANEKVMKWILDSETVQEPPTSGQDGDKSSSTHRRSHRLNQSSSTAHTPKQSSKSKGFGRSASVERSGGSSGIGTGTLGIFSSGGGGSNSSNLSSDRLQLASWGTGGSGHHHHHPVAVMPSQPFAQDPSMPLLTPPNPTTQLEEAKRRLENQQHQNSGPVSGQTGMSISLSGASSSLQARGAVLGGYSSSSGTAAPVKSKSFTGVLSKEKLRLPPSGTPLPPPHSRTLPTARTVPTDLDTSGGSQALDARLGRRVPASSSSAPTSIQPSQGDTIIGIYMGQEPIPYRHQLSGRTITLAQIRTLVTKRGPFKYYFKRPSDEFGDGAGAVFEEISDESAVVPMFQGKIVVKVEKLDS